MNRKGKLFCALLFMVMMASALSASEETVYTILDASSLRSGPGSSYAVVATLSAGERVIEEDRQGDWIKVRLSSGSKPDGWLYAAAAGQVSSAVDNVTSAGQQQLILKPAGGGTDALTPVIPVAVPEKTAPAIVWNDAVFGREKGVSGAVHRQAPAPASVVSAVSVNKPAVRKTLAFNATAVTGHGQKPISANEPGSMVVHGGSEQQVTTRDVLSEAVVAPTPQAVAQAPSNSAAKNAAKETVKGTVKNVSPGSATVALKAAKPVSTSTVSTSTVDTSTVGTAAKIVPTKGLHRFNLNSKLPAGASVTALVSATGSAQNPTSAHKPVMTTVSDGLSQHVATSDILSGTTAVPALKAAEQAPAKPVMEAAVMKMPGSADQTIKQTTTIRTGPGALYDVLGWAGKGAAVAALAQQGEWVKVRMQSSGRIGWVHAISLQKSAPAAVAAANLGLTAVETTNADKAAGKPVSPSPQVNALKSVKVASTGLAMPAPTAKVPEKKAIQLYVFRQTGNLLAGPGTQFARIGWVGRDESATVIAREGSWRRVNMTISGKRGWVPDSLLRVALPTGKIVAGKGKTPAATVRAKAVSVVFSETRQARVLDTVTLRTQADINSDMSGWVTKGDMVTAFKKQGGWLWVSPQLAGMQGGWIRADQLSLVEPSGMPDSIIGGAQPLSAYSDRISHGKTFNYSFAALEEARYRIPVENIEVNIDKDDLKAMFRKSRYDKSAFPVNILHGKYKLRGVIEVLGSSTRLFHKKSLRIKLDKDGGRWFGKRNIALQSMASDKSMMREWLSWKLMKAMGMKVPDVHFTRVNFNHGEEVGLYVSIEWVGKDFLAANGLDPTGEFYQPIDASHCGDLYTATNMDVCFDKINPPNRDYHSLSKMANEMVAATPADMDRVLSEYFNEDSVLNWIVANALVTDGDSYNKNYWLYHPLNGGKWTLVPWDYNLTFGRTYNPYTVAPFTIFNDNFQYYYGPDVGAGNPLKDKLLRNPRLRALIEAKIKHLTGMEPNGPEATFGWFSPTVMNARIANLAAVIGQARKKDTLISYKKEDFTKAYEAVGYYTQAHDYFLKYKLFGKYIWSPAPPNQPVINFPLPKALYAQGLIKAGEDHIHMVDPGWGYFVADLKLDRPLKKAGKFDIHIADGVAPRYLPRTMLDGQCIRRSWTVSADTPGTDAHAKVMFEYLQENSKRTEVPPTLHEDLLQLWMLDGHRWRPLETEVNQYSNTLTATDIDLKYGQARRFVACSPF